LLRNYYSQLVIQQMFANEDKDRWGLWKDGSGEEIIKYYKIVKQENFKSEKANEFFWNFIGKVQYNRPLILLAQRKYINETFGEYNQMDDIEDTDAPWDWDHIYPSEWVYRKGNCNQSIRDWNNTNGNLRALALEQNRSESNSLSPKVRLTDANIRESSFVKQDWKKWDTIDNRIWDDKVENHFFAITTRMVNIYESFWNDFKIDDLITTNTKVNND